MFNYPKMKCLRYNIRRCNVRRCNVHEPNFSQFFEKYYSQMERKSLPFKEFFYLIMYRTCLLKAMFTYAATTLCTTAISSSLFSCKTLCEEKNLLVVKKERQRGGRFLYVLPNYIEKPSLAVRSFLPSTPIEYFIGRHL